MTLSEILEEINKEENIVRNAPYWKEAFEFYNYKHPETRPLGMGCFPCYLKVRAYLQDYVKQQQENAG